MKKPSATNYLKIGQASKALGVHIDTLRRWEKSGKLRSVKTTGGTRFYTLKSLKNIKPEAFKDYSVSSQTTEELLKRTTEERLDDRSWKIDEEVGSLKLDPQISNIQSHHPSSNLQHPISLLTKFLIGTAALSAATLLTTSLITTSYLTHPKETAQFFKNNVASGLLSPFHKLAEETVAVISPKKAKELGFAEHLRGETEPPPIAHLGGESKESNVLATTSSPQFLEINSDTQINGNLFVRDQINNLSLEGTPSASTITLSSGDTTLTVTNNATLDQDVSTTSSPAFAALNLSGTKDQLIFQSGGPTGTLTWTPTGSAKIITLPNATTTLVGKDTTDTLTNKSISGSTNTLTSIPNSALTNKKVTISAGTNLSGGGDVELGASLTLSVKSAPSFSGQVLLSDGTAAAPGLAFTDDVDTGLYRIGTNSIGLITAGSATSGITINASGNLGVGTITPTSTLHVIGTGNITGNATIGGTLGVTGATTLSSTLGVTGATTLSSTLTVSGNTNIDSGTLFVDTSSNRVGIGTTTPGSNLGIFGNVGIGESFATAASPSNGLAIQGNVGIGTTTPAQALHVIGSGQFSTSILNADGSASAPAYSFAADTDTGLWRIGSNQLALTTGGGSQSGLSINSSGNLGIGNTSASARFQVNANTQTPFVVQSGGNVGIGTTIPGAQLTVIGNVGIGTSSAGANLQVNGNGIFGFSTTTSLTGPTNGLAVSGNVGIGTTTANYNLSVIGTGNFTGQLTLADGSASSPALSFTNDTDSGLWRVANNLITLTTGGGAVSGLAIDSSGNVGIGTTSPSTALHVIGNTTTSGSILAGVNNTYDIGTAAITYRTIYANEVNATTLIGTITGGNVSAGTLTINSDNASADTEDANLRFHRGTGSPHALLTWDSTNDEFDLNSTLHLTGTILGNVGINLDTTTYDITTPSGQNLSIFPGLGGVAGNVGIGTTTPGTQLSVSSNATIGFGGTSSIAGPSSGLAVSGNVGVGTTTTNSALTVAGGAVIGAGINATAPTNGLLVQGNVGIGYTSPTSLVHLLQTSAADAFRVDDVANDLSPFVISADGNVGIANSAPSFTLDVVGTGRLSSTLTVEGSTTLNGAFTLGDNGDTGSINTSDWDISTTGALTGIGAITADGLLTLSLANQAISLTGTNPALTSSGTNPLTFFPGSGNVGIGTSDVGGTLVVLGTSGAGTGNVGIGFTTPTANLHILNTGSGLSLRVDDVANDLSPFVISADGNVGIANSAPSYILDVIGTGRLSSNLAVGGSGLIGFTTTSVAPSSGLAVSGNVGIGTTTANSNLSVIGNAHIGALSGISAPANGLFVDGNVGIGATTSSNLLDVWGNARITGTLTVDSTSTFGGNLTLSGNLLPNANDTYDLGSNTLRWDELFLGPSTLHIGTSTSDEYTLSYDTTNNRLGFNVNGSGPSEIVFDSSGNVGIGLTNPSQLFQINASGTSAFVVTSGGNVGIGFTSPDRTLQVALDANPAGTNASLINTAGTTQLSLTGSTAGGLAKKLVLGIDTTDNFGVIQAGNTSGTNYTLALNPAGGNVGIGITTPLQALHVIGSGQFSTSILNADGSASAPAYSFSADTDTGIFRPSTNALGFSTGGSSRLTITAAGRIGIGTTAPAEKIHLLNDDAILWRTGSSTKAQIQGGGGSIAGLTNTFNLTTANANPIFIGADGEGVHLGTYTTDWTAQLSIIDNGNVGIGFSVPSQKFQVNANTSNPFVVTSGGNVGIGFTTPTSLLQVSSTAAQDLFRVDDNGAGDTSPFVVNLDGNVGIANSAPSYTLDVIGTSRFSSTITSSGVFLAPDGTASAPAYSFSADTNSGLYRFASDGIALITGGASSNLLSLNSSGNVGVGTTSPTRILELARDLNPDGTNASLLGADGTQFAISGSTFAKKLVLGIDTTDNYGVIQAGNTDGTNYNLILNPAGGNIGIGTTSPTAALSFGSTSTINTLAAGNLTLQTGAGSGSGAGGTLALTGGAGGATGAGGPITLTSGAGGATSGASGGITLQVGTVTTSGNGGALQILGANGVASNNVGSTLTLTAGSSVGTGTGGAVNITAGNTTGASTGINAGDILLTSGGTTAGGPSGSATLTVQGFQGSGASGGIGGGITLTAGRGNGLLAGGAVTLTGGQAGDAGSPTGGAVSIAGGAGVLNNSAGGAVTLTTGAGVGTGASGTLTLASGAISTGTAGSIIFATNGSSNERARFNAAGNLGIGISAPDRLLHVASTIDITASNPGLMGVGGTQFDISGATTNAAKKLVLGLDTTDNYGVIQAGSTDGTNYTLALNPAGGNVGIGYTSPTANLHILNTGSQDSLRIDDVANDLSPFVVAADGNVGIANSAPSFTLDVVGTGRLSSTLTVEGSTTLNGAFTLGDNGDTGSINTSDWDISTTGALTGIGAITADGLLTLSVSNQAISLTGTNPALTSSGTNPLTFFPGSGNVGIGTSDVGGTLVILGPSGAGTGNVGIGFTTPTANLHILNTGSGNSFRVDDVANDLSPFVISADGNVGIANSAPSYALDVVGSSRFSTNITQAAGQFLAADGTASVPAYSFSADTNSGLYRFASDGIALITGGASSNLLSLNSSGNVGVGTTSPLQALHVVGQCVAWDTRIRIRRRRKGTGDRLQGTDDDIIEYDYLEVMIKDILPGDEVLSLNEQTQEFEYQKVEKLLDMGIKGVFELTTKSGRTIKTTGNHPYLVHLEGEEMQLHLRGGNLTHHSPIQDAGWVKVINLKVGDQIAANNLSSGTSRFFDKDIVDNSNRNNTQKGSNLSQSNLWGQINHTSSNKSSALIAKYQNSIAATILNVNTSKSLVASIAPNQSTTKLEQTAENTLNWALEGVKENFIIQNSTINQTGYQWVHPETFEWDTIVSIKYLGYEHVYDLQIENTHNFLANNIVAHNTYITGNVGLGVTTPGSTLSINGNSVIGYSGVNIAGPSSGLAVSGNVGIGITTANSTLSVAGSAHIGSIRQGISAPANGLFVDGNVGIGATTSSNILDVWGNARITGTLTVDQGTTFSGNLTLGGNLLPSTDDTYDLGSNTLRWDELFLGPATIHIGTSTSDEYTLSYDTTNNRLGFNVNGSGPSEIVFDSSGNVGIGLTNPSQLFQINASGTSAFVVTSGGNVGIGFTTPDRTLQVALDANPAGTNASLINTAGTTQLALTGSTAGGLAKKLVLGIDTTDNFGVIQAGNTSGTNYDISLNPAGGNVGIGTVSPAQPLSVYIDAASTNTSLFVADIGRTTSGTAAAGMGGGITWTLEDAGGNLINTNAIASTWMDPATGVRSARMDFYRANANTQVIAMSIDNLGNVGIGMSAPDRLLHIASTINIVGSNAGLMGVGGTQFDISGATTNAAKKLVLGIDTTDNYGVIQAGNTDGTNYTLALNPAGGNIGIGTTNPLALLQVGTNTTTAAGGVIFGTDTNLYRSAANILTTDDNLFINDNANANMTLGLTINQGTNDNNIIDLKSSDVGHPFTGLSLAEADTYGVLFKSQDTSGGLALVGLKDADGVAGRALLISGYLGEAADTTKTTSATGVVLVEATITDGGTSRTSVGADGNLFVIHNLGASSGSARFILDAEGELHLIPASGTRTMISPSASSFLMGGNVGIATSGPEATLAVVGNSTIGFGNSATSPAGPSNGLAVSGNVGIGTTTANSTLSVAGNVHIGALSGISAPANGLFVDGNVGIGATTSSNILDVWGNARITGTLTLDSTSTFGGNLTLSGNLLPNADDTYDLGSNTLRWDELFLGPTTLHIGTSTSDEYTLSYDTTNNRLGFNVNGSGPAEVVFDSSGNIGIGTTGPVQLFQINPSGTSAFVVNSTGNVGIGFTSPTALLHLLQTSSADALRIDDVANDTSPFVVNLDGNVGIANSAPSYTLDVIGTTRFSSTITSSGVFLAPDGTASAPAYSFSADTNSGLYRFAADGIALITGGASSNLLSLNSSGNVGVGTTSPLQALHVVGQCVTGDTRLRRRRRKKLEDGRWIDEYDDVRIDQIKSGDEILTLDEATGKFIPSQVKALMDMGIQQTYLLITETGKQIRTTANHPYLVREDLMLGRRLFVESNISQQSNNHGQGKSYSYFGVDISKINHGFNPFLNLMAVNKHTIPSIALTVNNPNLASKVVLEKGTPQAIINQAADKLTSKSDNVIVTTESNLLTDITLSDQKLSVNQGENWIKVSQIKAGMEVATTDGWEKIVSIKEYAREQVWDIEVEGTHNFVGNNIVAHNTYINSGLNIGAAFTGGAAVPTNGLAVSGNVGIGTTTANSTLSVAGSAHIGGLFQGTPAPANGLFVDGNVGIGATTSSNLLDVWGNARITGTLTVDGSVTSSSSQFLAGNGSASSPSYSFTNLTNAGLWTNGNGLLLTTGGTNTSGITVTGAGNVGIGITSPSQIFQVNSGTNSVVVNSSGNVGIGTTSPGSRLHMRQDTASDQILTIENKNGAGRSLLEFYNDSSSGFGGAVYLPGSTHSETVWQNRMMLRSGSAVGGITLSVDSTTGDIRFITGGTAQSNERMRITSAGNIGIGTTTPGATLGLVGNATIGFGNSATSPAGPSSGLAVSGNVGVGTTTANSALAVAGGVVIGAGFNATAPTNGLLVQGNVGIGYTSPTALLHLLQTSSADALRIDDVANDTSPFVVNLDGNVGIANSAPSYALDVIGTSRFSTSITQAAGQLLLADGTASLPALSFASDTNTGLFRAGTDALDFTTGGTERLSITAAGNVGIGNTNPSAILELTGNLLFTKEANRTISVQDTTSTNTAGGNLTLQTGAGSGSGAGGTLALTAGAGGATGAGGPITLTSGAGGATSGASGGITLQVGTPVSGNAGALQILGAAGVGSNNVGSTITITAGNSVATGTGGAVNITAGTATEAGDGAGGAISLTSGNGTGGGNGGALTLAAGGGGGSATGGAVTLTSGVAGGAGNGGPSGAVTIGSGVSGAGSDAGTGNMIFQSGLAGNSTSGAAGASGAVTVRSQAGGNSNTNNAGASGTLTLSTGNGGSVVTSTGTGGAAGAISITGGNGGGTNAVTGGAGAGITLTAGSGGTGSTTGGAAGAITLVGGNAGSGGSINGGGITLRTGTGTGSGLAGSIIFQTAGTTERMRIDAAGNVGIGTTLPDRLLHLNSDINIVGSNASLLGTTGTQLSITGSSTTTSPKKLVLGIDTTDNFGVIQAGNTDGINYSLSLNPAGGNVGVGTTSPLQALHVVGQCVAWDTRLKRRKRKKNGEWSDEYEDVEIKDIKEGDQILSLNESTGKFEPHKVKGLMDMGKQEVFMLVTQFGKTIETTSNHPYLTLEKAIKRDQPKSSVFEVDQSPKMEILTQDSVVALGTKDQAFTLKIDRQVKRQIFNKYYKDSPKMFGPELFAHAIVELLQKSETNISRLEIDTDYPGSANGIRIAELIRKHYPLINVHFKAVGKHSSAHLAAYLTQTGRKVQKGKKEETLANLKLKGFLASELLHPEFTGIRSPHGLFTSSNYTTKWVKVKYLNKGDIIATVDGWEKISAKYSTGKKQTLDIEIENTHNFVGNNIVAHNTYITGNVGLGVTTPGATLSINGNSVIGYSGVNIAGPSSGLAVSGNVGIGTTTANSNLSVIGNAHIGALSGISAPANGLFVDGNVGIGATTSSNLLDVWGNARITGTLTVDQGTTFSGNLTLGGNLLPSTDDTYDLGSNTLRWDELFLGPATLHIGTSTSDEYTLSYDTTNNRLGFNVNGSGPAEIVMDSSGNLGIGTTGPVQLFQINPSGTSAFVVTSGGNVGIGFTTPDRTLQVALDANPAGTNASLINTAGTTQLALTGSTAGGLAKKLVLGIDTTDNYGVIQAGNTSGTNYSLALNPAGGNVGIGTTTPLGIFEVKPTAASSGNGAPILLTAQQGSAAGTGGALTLTSGAGGSTSGASGGSLVLIGGNSSIALASQFTSANSEWLSIADNASLSTGNSDFTIAAWVYLDSTPASGSEMFFYSKDDGVINSRETGLLVNNTAGTIRFRFYTFRANAQSTPDVVDASTFGTPSTGTWYFVVGRRTAGVENSISVNAGTTDTLAATNNPPDGASDLNIGRRAVGDFYMNGRIASVGFWKKVLTAAEITSLYNSGNGLVHAGLSGSLLTSLISYWNLSEASGSRADSAGTNTLADNATVTGADGPAPTTTGIGGAVTLTGGQGGATGAGGALTLTSGAGGSTSGASGALTLATGTTTSGATGALTLRTGVATGGLAGSIIFQTAGTTERMRIDAAGNVGIGTTTPDRLLHLNSDINIVGSNTSLLGTTGTQFSITGSSTTTSPKKLVLGIDTTDNYGVIQAGNTDGTNYTLALNPAGGNVGIGTTSPVKMLHLSGVDPDIRFDNTDTGGRKYIIGSSDNNNSLGGGKFYFYDETAGATRVVLDNSGNVGIGFTSPRSRLDVYQNTASSDVNLFVLASDVGGTNNVKFRIDSDGDSFTDGVQTIGTPADIAENYPVLDESIESGDVVTTSMKDLVVEKSTTPYQGNILGIISTNPGVILSGNTQGRAVALAGRVPVKVSTENGPIEVGDYLTSSSTPGVAMKALRPGQVVGKALEAFDSTSEESLRNTSEVTGTGSSEVRTGKILTFVNVSFADPGNFFASLSLDESGNLIIPKIRTASIILDQSLATSSASLRASETSVAISTDPAYTDPGPQLASNSNNYIDLGGTIASLESRIQNSELRIKEQQAQIKNLQDILGNVGIARLVSDESERATSSATLAEASPSAVILANEVTPESTDSGVVATAPPQNDSTNLNLTPPDILFYTGSATLANLKVTSEATMSGQLTAYQAEIKDHFKVLGQTTLSNTIVVGDLTVDGTLSVENGSEINVIGVANTSGVGSDSPEVSTGILYLQRSPLAQGLDIFNGKVVVDKDGNITITGEVAAASIVTNKLTISNIQIASSSAILAPTIGTGKIPAGTTNVTILTNQVTDSAKIFVTPRSPTLGQALVVNPVKAAESFTVSLNHPLPNDLDFDWWLVETN